jgi:predicted phage tail protein
VDTKILIVGSGGGKGGGEARQAVEEPDNLHSSQYAKVVDAISEGEIDGLVDGNKSIFFNETALQNDAGTYNFDGVDTYAMAGTQEQGAIPGFGGVRGQTSVGIEVKRGVGAPPPITINQGNLDAVSVTLSVSQLTKQDKVLGDIHGTKVDYSIQVAYQGGKFEEVVAASFDGKTTSKYTREHRIELWQDKLEGKYISQINIKVVRLTKHPVDSATNDAIFWESYTKIIDNKLTYPNTALMGIRINARQFNAIPKRAYHIRGIKCKVPHNYTGYEPTSYCTSRSYTSKSTCTGIDRVNITHIGTSGAQGDAVIFTAPNTPALEGDKTAEGTLVVGVVSVNITDIGQDYENGDYVVFSEPDIEGGERATGYLVSGVAFINDFPDNIALPSTGYLFDFPDDGIAEVIITNPGSGYTSAPTVTFDAGGGTGAEGTAYIGVVEVDITEPGTGYVADGAVSTNSGFSGIAVRGGAWKDGVQPGDVLYEGYFNGDLDGKVIWTTNPAWIYYDLLTNKRYGLGDYLQENQIDKWSLYQIGRYCDAVNSAGEFVGVKSGFKLGGDDVWEPRFATNVYIQDQQEAIKVVQDLAFAFRGLSYWSHGQLVAVQDSPKEPTQLFTAANVVDGEFGYSGTSQKARKTVALVSWNDPKNFYKRKIEYVEDREGIKRYGIRKTDITSFGCTSRGQAHRLGLWTLFTDTLETETLVFKAGIEAAVLQPGELIKVADTSRSGNRYGGRIKSGSTKTNIILDSPLENVIPHHGYKLNVIHTDDACLHPQEISFGVPHPHAGELYIPVNPGNPGELEDKEVCISDGGQWSPYMFIENYPVNILSDSASSIDISSEISNATGGGGVDIVDTQMSFSHKFHGITVTNLTTSNTAVIDNVISATQVTVSDFNGFASQGDSLEYHHELTNTPNADYMWLLEEMGVVEAQVFRVLGVKEAKKNEYEVLAMEYHADKYRIIEEGLNFEELDELSISRIPNITDGCPPPSDLDIYEQPYSSSDGSVKNKAVIRWKPPIGYSFIRDYIIKYRVNNGIWIDAGNTEYLELEILDAVAGTYEAKVAAQSVLTNTMSSTISASATLVGLSKPPSSVTSFCRSIAGIEVPYLKTLDTCERQGRCSILGSGGIVANTEAECSSLAPVDASGNLLEEIKCEELFHNWEGTSCIGKWTSDYNTWETDPSRFTVVNDPTTGTYLSWEEVTDLDLHHYDVRMSMDGVKWDYAVPIVHTNTLSYGGASGLYLASGTHTYLIKAVDTSNVESAEVSKVSTSITGPNLITGEDFSFVGTNVVLKWTKAVQGTYNVVDYEVRYGDNWAGSEDTHVLTGGSASIAVAVGWGSSAERSRKFWIAAKDKANNYSTPVLLKVEVLIPKWGNIDSWNAHELVRDSLILNWSEPDVHSLPVENYELRKGGDEGDKGSLVGIFKTLTHTMLVNWSKGDENFWIKAIDSAGNYSEAWEAHVVTTWAPFNVITVKNSFIGSDLVLTWGIKVTDDSPLYTLEIDHWIVTDKETNNFMLMKGPRHTEKVTWIGNDRVFSIIAVDTAGNKSKEGVEVTIDVVDPVEPFMEVPSIGADSVTVAWSAPTSGSLEIREYILRKGKNWLCTFVVPCPDGGNNVDITKFLGLSYTQKVDWAVDQYGDMSFFIQAVDTAGNKSPEPVTNSTDSIGWAMPDLKPLGAITNVEIKMAGKRVDLTWKAPTDTGGNSLELLHYQIEGYKANTLSSDGSSPILLKTTGSTSYSEEVTWTTEEQGIRVFTVTPVDAANNKGTATDISVAVPKPERPGMGQCSNPILYTKAKCGTDASATWAATTKTLTSVVVDNNVLLRWGTSSNVLNLDIETYEVRRCPDSSPSDCIIDNDSWAGLLPVTTTTGQFISHMETISNEYKYGVVAIDVAGNYSETTELLVSVSEPPDFVLQNEFVSTLDEDFPIPATVPPLAPELTKIEMDNIFRGASIAFLPVGGTEITETWEQHFTNNSFGTSPEPTFQNVIDSGYAYYLQPTTPANANFWQMWDLGVELDSSNVSLSIASTIVDGGVAMEHTMYYSNAAFDSNPDNWPSMSIPTNWTELPSIAAAISEKFRYIKIYTEFITDPTTAGFNLISLDEYKLKLSIKTISDSAEVVITDDSGICNKAGGLTIEDSYCGESIGTVMTPSIINEEDCEAGGGTWYPIPIPEGDNNISACTSASGDWFSTRKGLKVSRVFFNKDFKDIRDIVATVKLGSSDPLSLRAIIDFVDIAGPEYFYVHIIDTAVYNTGTYDVIYNTGTYDVNWDWTDSLDGSPKSFNGTVTWNSTGTK